MRLISQDGYVDIPYDLSALSVGDFADKIVIYVRSKLFDEKPFVIAEYSSETKALIVMEKLRKTYSKNPNYGAEVEFFEDLVFQFPKYDEV
jgi:hypothetical protein